MSDLRDSGQIEQDADQIVLVWRPSEYDPDAPKTDMMIVVPKSRHTESISQPVKMRFDGRRQIIEEYAPAYRFDETEAANCGQDNL